MRLFLNSCELVVTKDLKCHRKRGVGGKSRNLERWAFIVVRLYFEVENEGVYLQHL